MWGACEGGGNLLGRDDLLEEGEGGRPDAQGLADACEQIWQLLALAVGGDGLRESTSGCGVVELVAELGIDLRIGHDKESGGAESRDGCIGSGHAVGTLMMRSFGSRESTDIWKTASVSACLWLRSCFTNDSSISCFSSLPSPNRFDINRFAILGTKLLGRSRWSAGNTYPMSIPTPVLSSEVGITNLLTNGSRTNLFREGSTAAHSKTGSVCSTM